MCIFHESAHNRERKRGGIRSRFPPSPHCDFSLFRNSIHLFAGLDRSLRMFRSHSGRNATGTVLINGTSGRAPTCRAINLNRRDTRFSNKALHNSDLSYPPRLSASIRNDKHFGGFEYFLRYARPRGVNLGLRGRGLSRKKILSPSTEMRKQFLPQRQFLLPFSLCSVRHRPRLAKFSSWPADAEGGEGEKSVWWANI